MVKHARGSFSTYGLIELRVSLRASYRNPFDPAEIDLHAVFRSPAGARYSVNGFYYQNYSRVGKASGPTILKKVGGPEWRIRFAAPAPGSWSYRIYLRDRSGRAVSSDMGSPVHVNPDSSPGYVRVSSHDAHYLAFDNGEPYFPVGENMAFWYHPLGIQDYYYWLNGRGKLHDQGATFIGVWVAPPTFAVDYTFPLGNFAPRMGNAWAFDQVLNLAARDGIEVLPSLEQHANFELRGDWSWDWRKNPYDRTRGGPARTPCDFFSNPVAIAMFERNLRYIVARWGYSTTILGWELFNEVDLVPGFWSCSGQALRWHQLMAGVLHSLDPVRRPITTSFAHMPGYAPIWRLPGMDIVQSHHYSYNSPSYIAADLRTLRQYGKPAWMGEFGFSIRISSTMPDRSGRYIHIAQWASLMSGAAGSGFNWWWEAYVDRFNTYSTFRPLPRFLAGVPLDREGFTPLAARLEVIAPGATGNLFTLRGRSMSLLWLLVSRSRRGRGGEVTISAMNGRQARVQWWDTASGVPIAAVSVSPKHGILSLTIPGDAPDYAAKIWQ